MLKILNNIIKISIYSLVFLIPLFFSPFSYEAFEINKQYLLFFLVSVAVLAWLARMVFIDKEIKFKKTPLDIPILVFLAVSILSAIFPIDRFSSLLGAYGNSSNSLVEIISMIVLYFLISNNVDGVRKPIRLFLISSSFIILSGYFAVFGIWTKLADFDSSLGIFHNFFSPISGSVEGLAVFLSVLLVLLIGILLTKAGKNNFIHWILSFSILILLIIFDFTPAWIILTVVFSLFLFFALITRLFKENINKLLLPIILLIISAIFIFINPRFSFNPLPTEPILGQGESWGIALKAVTSGPKNIFFGSGIGTFSYDFSKFKSADFNDTDFWQLKFSRAGNNLAEIMGTTGFLGILAYLIIIGLFLIIIWIMAKADTVAADGDNYILPLSLVFLALVVSQLFYYQNTVLAFVFWLILGLSLSRWQKNFGALEYSFKEFPEIGLVLNVVFIMVLIGFAGMCIFGARFYIADSVYAKAFLAEDETTQISYLEKAASLNPYRIQYKILLSRLYLAKVLREAGKSDAEQDMGKLSCDFSLAIAYARGLTMSKICVFPDASAEEQITIKGAVQISPNSAAALENLGIIYREVRLFTQGANELAIEAFSKAIELDPANPVLYTELGKLLLAGKLDDAKKNFDKAAELKPNYPDAVIQQALLLEGEGSLNDAVTKLENLAASNPFDAEVLFQLGRMYYNNNRADEATSILQRVVFLFPNYSNAHYVLGIIYSSKGEKDSAIAEFEKVLELNPGNQDVIDKINSLKD